MSTQQEPSFTKKAYARGVGERLQQRGVIQFPTVGLLKQACDVTASYLSVEPREHGVPHADVVKIAQALVQTNQQLTARGKTASHPSSVSMASRDLAYGDLVQKIASAALGSTITGDNPTQKNTEELSVNAEAALDLADRPMGYAVVGQGNTGFSEPQSARVGVETDHPKQPVGVEGAHGNSVTEASKSASIMSQLHKLAGGLGSTITGSDAGQKNTQPNSENAEAHLDLRDRPEGYAVVGEGNANFSESSAARVGTEENHPKKPAGVEGASSNSVTDASKTARWERHFEETAREIGPRLPENMPRNEKVAAVKACMSLEPYEQEAFLAQVTQKHASAAAQPASIEGLLRALNMSR